MKLTKILVVSLSLTCVGGSLRAAQPAKPALNASAQGTAFTMGEIGRRASYGSDGAWKTSASADGSLVLASQTNNPGWTADIVKPPVLPYTIEVKLHSGIAPLEGHAVGAGVLFGFERANGSTGPKFFAAMVSGDTLFVYALDGSFQQLVRSGQTHAPQDFDTLRVTVRADGFSVSLNDNGSVSQSVGSPPTGDFGVIASGAGQATFRDLIVH